MKICRKNSDEVCLLPVRMPARRVAISAALAAMCLTAPEGFAASQYFSDAGGPKNWDTSTADWGTVSLGPYTSTWTSGNTAIFETTGGTVNVGSPTFGGITFNVNSCNLSGGTLNFGNAGVTIQGNSTAALSGTTISSVIAGGGASAVLTFNGVHSSSSMILSGANTYSAANTVVEVFSSGLTFNSLNTSGNSSSFGTSGTVSMGVLSSADEVIYNGTGSGSTDRGWLLAGTGASTILNNGGGALSFNYTGNLATTPAGARSLILGGSYVAAPNIFAETINDLGTSPSITTLKISGGIWDITGLNTFSGGVTLTGGTLEIGNASALGTGALTIGANSSFDNATGASLSVNNGLSLGAFTGTYVGSASGLALNGPVTLTGNGTLSVSANTLTLGGQVSGAFTLTKSGSGTLFLAGANSHNGTTIGSTGTLLLDNDTALGTSTAGLTFSASGTLAATNNGASVNNAVTIGSSRVITINSGVTAGFSTPDTNNLIIDAQITGAGAVSKKSSSFALGTVRFSNDANNFTGDFSVGYGATEFTSVANQGVASSLGVGASGSGGVITIGNSSSSGTLRYVGATDSSTTRPLDWTASTGGYALDVTNTAGTIAYLNTTDNLVTAAGAKTLTLQGSNMGANTLAQVINDSTSGATTLVKSGAGQWVLTGANTFSGTTTISDGVLALSGNGSIANTPSIIIGSGATFDVSGLSATFTLGSSQTLSNSTSTATLNGNINTGSGTVSLTYVSGTPSLSVTNGALTLSPGTVFNVNNTGAELPVGSYKLIAAAVGGSVSGTVPAAVTVGGKGAAASATLQVVSGELYLNVGVTPPVAQTMTVTRNAGLGLHIALSDVATNWSDANSYTVTLAGINMVTTNGVNLTTNSSFIFYANSANVNDQISYTITDGHGGTAVGYINIVVSNSVPGSYLISGVVPGATNIVTSYGIPNYTYILERTSTLSPAAWVDISTNTASTNGLINAQDTFWDLGGVPPPSAYYRLKYQP